MPGFFFKFDRNEGKLWLCEDVWTIKPGAGRQAGRQAELLREYLDNRQMDKWGYTQLIRCTANSRLDVSRQNSPLSHTEGLWVATLLWCVVIFFQWELKVALAEKCDICNAVRALMLVGFSAPPPAYICLKTQKGCCCTLHNIAGIAGSSANSMLHSLEKCLKLRLAGLKQLFEMTAVSHLVSTDDKKGNMIISFRWSYRTLCIFFCLK